MQVGEGLELVSTSLFLFYFNSFMPWESAA